MSEMLNDLHSEPTDLGSPQGVCSRSEESLAEEYKQKKREFTHSTCPFRYFSEHVVPLLEMSRNSFNPF